MARLFFFAPDGADGTEIQVQTVGHGTRQIASLIGASDLPGAEASVQSAWEVDPATGNDDNIGTPAAPLATVGELNRRLSNVRIAQTTTIALIGNQLDALNLANLGIANGATVTISGEATDVATGAISVVTPLGGAGTIAPWQLVTTGLDWTATTERRIQITSGASLGAVAWVLSVIDANTVIIGALGTLTTNTIVPTNVMTFAVQTLNTIPMSQFYVAQGAQLPATLQSLVIRDLSFVAANGSGNLQTSGPRIAMFGCQLTMPGNAGFLNLAESLVFRQCRFLGSALSQWHANVVALTTFIGCTFNNGTAVVRGGVRSLCTMISSAFDGALLAIQSGCNMSGSTWLQNVNSGTSSGAILVSAGGVAFAFATNSFVEGQNITGAGICVESGAQFQYNPATKPTITGSISDTRIGGVIQSYAAVPRIEPLNNAMLVEIAN